MSTSKYATLGEYLLTHPKDKINLSFSEIEEILGFPLPKSAYKFRTWWSNDKAHSHAENGWLSVGWRITKIDFENNLIQFKRVAALRLTRSIPASTIPREVEPSRLARVRKFEMKAREILSEYFNQKLRPGMFPKIVKLFDFVSKDRKIVGEAKYLSLGRKRIQPSKFAAISETVWLLEKIKTERKFIVFGNDKDVPLIWLNRYGPLIRDIKFYFLNDEGHLEILNEMGKE